MKFCFFSVVVVLWSVTFAEPPVPQSFGGYERGGYEVQPGGAKTFPGADQLNFPPSGEGPEGSQGAGNARNQGGRPGTSEVGGIQGEFPSGEAGSLDSRQQQQQRGSGRFEGGGEGEDAGDSEGSLDDIPGVAGKDYPIYGDIPTTSFSCDQQSAPGYYADVDTQCQVFHICQKGGQKNSVLCPNGTIFNQKVFVCSWWYDFDCDTAPGLFALNEQVNAEGEQAAGRAGNGGGGAGGYDAGNREELGRTGYSDGQDLAALTRHTSLGGSNTIDPDTFGGYDDNGPNGDGNSGDLPSTGPSSSDSQSGGGQRGASRFPSGGQSGSNSGGYSDNGPSGGFQTGNRNDLTTSGGGDPSGRRGGDEGEGYSRGRGRGEQGVEGGRASKGGHDLGDNNLESISIVAEGTQYLPPTGSNNDQSRSSDRNYLPPKK